MCSSLLRWRVRLTFASAGCLPELVTGPRTDLLGRTQAQLHLKPPTAQPLPINNNLNKSASAAELRCVDGIGTRSATGTRLVALHQVTHATGGTTGHQMTAGRSQATTSKPQPQPTAIPTPAGLIPLHLPDTPPPPTATATTPTAPAHHRPTRSPTTTTGTSPRPSPSRAATPTGTRSSSPAPTPPPPARPEDSSGSTRGRSSWTQGQSRPPTRR